MMKKTTRKQLKREPQLGDFSVLVGILKSPLWKAFLVNTDKAILLLLKYWAGWFRGMINWSFCAVFRTKNVGENQNGWLISCSAIFFLISFNSTSIWLAFKGLGTYYLPISLFWKTEEEMLSILFFDINSKIVLGYTFLVMLSSLYRIYFFHFGKKNNDELSDRGISWVYLFFKGLFRIFKVRNTHINREFIESKIEPLLLGCISMVLFNIDKYGSGLFAIMFLSEVTIQAYNKAITLKHWSFENI